MQISKVGQMFITAWNKKPRYISMCGGTRSGKTYSILQTFVLLLMREEATAAPATVNSIVSETFPHLRKGVIRDFINIMKGEEVWNEDKWNKTESTYTFDNGSILEFFSADNAGKVHGASRQRLFINECQFIPEEIARQLFIRTTGLVVFDYNPTHVFWAIEKYEPRDNCITIHSTYKDNDYLTREQVAEIESNANDENWWRVYGLGKVGVLEGLVYPDFEQVDALPGQFPTVYGMDFGFVSDPTACVKVEVDTGRKVIYADEICYRRGMLNSDICDELQRNEVPLYSTPIYADCAEPKSIEEISRAGFNIKPCDKSAPVKSDRLKFQIMWLKGFSLKVTKRSTNLIKELRNYTWAKDKDGNTMSYPIDDFNHCFTGDTLVTTQRGEVRIDEVRVGDMALTSAGWRRVSKTFYNGWRATDIVRLHFTEGIKELHATPTHRIYTQRGWVMLSDLRVGDVLTVEGRGARTLLDIDSTEGGTCPVYDLQVEGRHEYFANCVLVHNCLDALRYGCYTHFANHGRWRITI